LTASNPLNPLSPRITRRIGPALAAVCLLLLPVALASDAHAQGRTSYSITLGPTFGGSIDGEPEAGLEHTGFLANFSWRTQPRTVVGIRFGSTDLQGDELGPLVSPTFRYATISGEYRFGDLYYESGVFFGLGLYQLDDGETSDTGAGLTVGVTGDFPINERLSVLVELTGHYADLDTSTTHVAIHAGLSYHF